MATIRALNAADAIATRALISSQFDGTRYCERIVEQLESALSPADPEYRSLVAISSGDDERMLGLVLYGAVPGARGVVKLHVLAGDAPGVLGSLVDAMRASCKRSMERMIVCEIADDAPLHSASTLLLDRGFVEEARVADFIADGVALRLLVSRN